MENQSGCPRETGPARPQPHEKAVPGREYSRPGTALRFFGVYNVGSMAEVSSLAMSMTSGS